LTAIRQIDQQIIDLLSTGKSDEAQAISFLDEAIAAKLAKPFAERNELRAIRLKWVRDFVMRKVA
jgi:hypothetical protein